METFVREVRSLSHVRHPNLVALLGYCENEAECFLVYELCHNGSLSDWLFGIIFFPSIHSNFPKLLSIPVLEHIITLIGYDKVLSWIQRLEIAVDSARGLEFLHTCPGGCIVHRDIKVYNSIMFLLYLSFTEFRFLIFCYTWFIVSHQTFLLMPNSKQNFQTLGCPRLWTWVNPM